MDRPVVQCKERVKVCVEQMIAGGEHCNERDQQRRQAAIGPLSLEFFEKILGFFLRQRLFRFPFRPAGLWDGRFVVYRLPTIVVVRIHTDSLPFAMDNSGTF